MSAETLAIVILVAWNAAITWWAFNWYVDVRAKIEVHQKALIQILVRFPNKDQREIQERISELTKNGKRNV
jgi:hypothetical protein